MSDNHTMGRRAACATLLGIGGGVLAAGRALGAQPHGPPAIPPAGPAAPPHGPAHSPHAAPAVRNSDFYDADGKFKPEAAKEAYFCLLHTAGYPMSDTLRKNIWVSDFGLGRFTEVGLGGIFWVNDKEGNYMSLDMFLLPDQMIPEHWHVALEAEKVPVKMESWHVRWGSSFTYGEGEPTANIGVKIHDSEAKYVTVRHETPLKVGDVVGIKKPLEKHWQQAGPHGAVITETATYHSGAAVRFTNPNIKF